MLVSSINYTFVTIVGLHSMTQKTLLFIGILCTLEIKIHSNVKSVSRNLLINMSLISIFDVNTLDPNFFVQFVIIPLLERQVF